MDERCIFITGASSDTAMSFLERNVQAYSHVYAHYNHGNDSFEAFCDKYSDRIIPVHADLLNTGEIYDILKVIKEKEIYPDHFIHIASDKMTGAKFHKRDFSDFSRGFQVSVGSAVILLNVFLAEMLKKKYGRIIFMLTSCTFGIPPKYQSAYVTSKYALLGLMKSLSTEYASKGITVNGVSPEMMDTRFLDGTPKKEVILKENAERNPLGRNIETADVIPVLEYLLSDAAQAVTGQNIGITGGLN